ncbi:hypothetical protein C8R45DRAFT_920595 [Mycena sanguinolenta]|nr:hypothetical protein C8R45DRAFT_920595 [Mycena sanguinolenta]
MTGPHPPSEESAPRCTFTRTSRTKSTSLKRLPAQDPAEFSTPFLNVRPIQTRIIAKLKPVRFKHSSRDLAGGHNELTSTSPQLILQKCRPTAHRLYSRMRAAGAHRSAKLGTQRDDSVQMLARPHVVHSGGSGGVEQAIARAAVRVRCQDDALRGEPHNEHVWWSGIQGIRGLEDEEVHVPGVWLPLTQLPNAKKSTPIACARIMAIIDVKQLDCKSGGQ